MSNFERKFGKYAIRNISLVLVACYAIGYVINLASPKLAMYLALDPYAILHGQVWRLVTWILRPPSSLDFFTIIMLLFYYSIGTSLERTWGTYRYNVYLFSGMLFTIAGSFLAYLFLILMGGGKVDGQVIQFYSQMGSLMFSTYYINMSIFLAYAATFPDAQVLLMFVIPIKVKWMGIAYAVLLVIQFFSGAGDPILNLFYRFAVGASLLNFVVFWFTSKSRIHMSPKQVKRRQQFKSEVRRNAKISKHKCAVCGRTDEDDPSLEFRFCSKCNGNYEYCQHHLFTHEHVK